MAVSRQRLHSLIEVFDEDQLDTVHRILVELLLKNSTNISLKGDEQNANSRSG